jgi:alpha-galactosidase
MSVKLACLHSAEASLVLECRDGALPVWRHLGARVDPSGLSPLPAERVPASFSLDQDVPLSTMPFAGRGWFGPAAVQFARNGAAQVPLFAQVGVTQAAERITIAAADTHCGVALEQTIAALAGGAFAFNVTLRNVGSEPLRLDWLASALVPLGQQSERIVSWRGRHNAELVEVSEPMPQHGWLREGRRGISGHGGPPGLVVLNHGATWHGGLVHALQLAWSGDSRLAIERDDEGFWVLSAGPALQGGGILVEPGQSFTAPAAILAISSQGRNGAMAQQHAAVRALVNWPDGAMMPRKVHLNSWEACYFDHDAARIGALAEAAAAIGIERFVLDDGWFKGRNDDRAGLGDWTCDPIKYPNGLKPLADKVCSLGMEFGLWVEPEMVNPDSDLYRTHPDWALAPAQGVAPTARNQLVLDLARRDLREYLFGALDRLLRAVPISYLKWDHNRDLAPAGGWAQVQGTYELLARLRTAHPGVEIESCAGGGGRSDAGIAAYTHRFWASDNIDAVSRVSIQRSFLSFLPPELMGSHVGASPAHATGRSQSLAFRAAVALQGHFGVELDPAALSEPDRAELADWIAFYKQRRHLLHGGWLHQGEAADGLCWQAQGHGAEFLLLVMRCDPVQDRRPQPLVLPFLASAATCDLTLLRIAGGAGGHAAHLSALHQSMQDDSLQLSGSWLAHAGLPLPPLKAESIAIFHGRIAA